MDEGLNFIFASLTLDSFLSFINLTNGYNLEFMTGIENTVLSCPHFAPYTQKKPTDQASKLDTIGFF